MIYTVHLLTVFLLCDVLLFLPSMPLSAQENSGSINQSQRTYEVRGTVVNSVTHEPLARALVTIAGEASNAQLTDNEGRFDFPNIPAGGSVLGAKRPGFFSMGPGRDLFVPIAVGPESGDHTLALEPASTITGQVMMPASEPGNNIRVQLMRRIIQEGRASWQPFGMKVTNSEGAFRFGGLQPGDYKLCTENLMESNIMPQAPVNWGYPAVWYPEDNDSDTTGFIRIGPGQQRNAQLAITREPYYSVTIPVANRGTQGFGAQVSDQRGRLNDIPISYDPRSQEFRGWLPSGSYTVSIQSAMQSPGFASVPVTVRHAPVQLQGITVLPVHPISVTIHKEFASTNNSGSQFVLIENGKQVEVSQDVNLMLFSVTNHEAVGVSLQHEPGGDGSSWLLENVPPGRYWVQTYANQGYVASITAGGTDLARDPLVIGPGGASAAIDIELQNDMATLSVRAKNVSSSSIETMPSTETFIMHPPVETPLGYLYLIPQFDTTSVVPQSVPLQQTANTLNLQPGTYRLLAFGRPFDLEYRNPKALETYAGKGQTITLEPNGTMNIELDVIPVDAAAQ